MLRTVSEPGALEPLQVVPRTRLLALLFRAVMILRALRWVSYPVLVTAGLAANPWFLAGAPLVFLLDRAILGYVQVRLGVELAARVQICGDLTFEDIEPFPPESPWPGSEPFPPLDR
jgi:hypothetical protein